MCYNKIKEARKNAGLTQQALADKLSISISSIASYELGRRKPSVDVLIKMAEILDVTEGYLLGKK